MKRSSGVISAILVLLILSAFPYGCKPSDEPAPVTAGTFPDSVYNLSGLNSRYDDYNSDIVTYGGSLPLIFSSNRQSSGGQFDLVQGSITYIFDQKTGAFTLSSSITNDPFLSSLISKAVTTGNDFGPYSIYSALDGVNYLFLASQTGTSPLDIYYLKYLPRFGNSIPDITGPFPAKILNSSYDDGYVSFDLNEDSVYFSSNRGGDYDIYVQKRSSATLDTWMSMNFTASAVVDSVNSRYDDKCPFILKNYMVFASNRPGGLGGFDLYYSIFSNNKWSFPVNFGPGVNSSNDEYRPFLGYHPDFTNMFIVFSSNRTGGAGGYDLYFTSFNNPK